MYLLASVFYLLHANLQVTGFKRVVGIVRVRARMSKLSPQRLYSERVLCPTQHKKMLSPREVGPQVNGSSTCVAFQTMPATLQITLVKARKTNIISCYLCLRICTLTAFIIFGIGNQKKNEINSNNILIYV